MNKILMTWIVYFKTSKGVIKSARGEAEGYHPDTIKETICKEIDEWCWEKNYALIEIRFSQPMYCN